ncbi:MAG: carbon storage regulator CsrA [Ignavibacteriae bacterium]|nr:carbon storage regulator CsrA [Ignavibacteriota bacterium]
MLVLSRKIGDVITIGSTVKITVLSYDRGIVRLGIEAPKNIPVHRKEVFDKIIEKNRQAAKTNLSSLKFALSKSGVNLQNEIKEVIQPETIKFSSTKNDNTNID